MLPLSFRLERAGAIRRQPGSDSDWLSFGHTLMTQVTGGGCLLRTATERFVLGPGMGFLIPPGLRHRVEVPGAQVVTMRSAHLHCRVFEVHGLFTVLDRPVIFPRTAGQRIGACNTALIACHERGSGVVVSAEAAARMAELVTIAVASCPNLEGAWSGAERERLLPVLRHIQHYLAEPITRAHLAGVAGVSIPHLHTLFLRAFRTAPMDLVRRERMQHACQLLHGSEAAVAEVGRRCGYADPYHFSRAFSQSVGVSPTRYRRNCRMEDATG